MQIIELSVIGRSKVARGMNKDRDEQELRVTMVCASTVKVTSCRGTCSAELSFLEYIEVKMNEASR